MPSIRKALSDITPADLKELCRLGAIEDEQIDFKAAIPAEEGSDPWQTNERIEEYGRDQLLATVVAFANSYGGDLIIGIREQEPRSQPGKAASLSPILNCSAAATKLLDMAQQYIEPPIPRLQAVAIPIDANGSGWVVIRSPKSFSAPHRLYTKKDKECYHRVRDQTRAMSMRQIQDLTLSTWRRGDNVERRRSQLRTLFAQWADVKVQGHAHSSNFGYSVRAVPASEDCQLSRVHGVAAVRPNSVPYKVQVSPRTTDEYHPVMHHPNFRPVLRGTQATEEDPGERWRIQLFCDGCIAYERRVTSVLQPTQGPSENRHLLYLGWLLGCVVNVLDAADRFRVEAGATATDYMIDIDIQAAHDLQITHGERMLADTGMLPSGTLALPGYIAGARDTWNALLSLVWTDLWHAVGQDRKAEIQIIGTL